MCLKAPFFSGVPKKGEGDRQYSMLLLFFLLFTIQTFECVNTQCLNWTNDCPLGTVCDTDTYDLQFAYHLIAL